MTAAGPTTRSPDGLVDLTPAAQRYGMQGRVMVDPGVWSTFCLGGEDKEIALVDSLVSGMDRLLASDRADYPWFDFKHWFRKSERSKKADWVRLRATMFIDEEGTPWVQLTESPRKAHRWRGHSHV